MPEGQRDDLPPVAIPDQLKGRGCRFTIIPPAGYKYTRKDGSVKTYTGKDPQGAGWADEGGSNYAEDDPKLQRAISRRWNYGLVCGTGGVVVFDGDEATRLQELGVLQKIPPHRPGGEQTRSPSSPSPDPRLAEEIRLL